MKNDTRKIEAGWYRYRGVNIVKHEKGFDRKRGVLDPFDTTPTGWYVDTIYRPFKTLAAAKAAVDKKVDA